jgi:hydroxypyruvate reductase
MLMSDVPGDDPATIASGPTVSDPTTYAHAREVLRKYDIIAPQGVLSHLACAADETPKPGDPRLAGGETTIICKPQQSLEAAADVARAAGFTPLILSDSIEGEAREVGRVIAAIANQVARHDQPVAAPCVLISGGETTVTLRGGGQGGRNVEFLLSLALALDGAPSIWALAAGRRRKRGGRRRLHHAGHLGSGGGAECRRQGGAGVKRRARLLPRIGRPAHHRADAHQRQ